MLRLLCDGVVSVSVGLDEDVSIVIGGLWEEVMVSVIVVGLAEAILPLVVRCVGDNVVSETILNIHIKF